MSAPGAIDPRTPCVVGVAQRTVHPGAGPAPEPLALWEDVVRAAVSDAGGTAPGGVLPAVDSLQVVHCMSWPYDAPVDRLAGALGIEPRHRHYSGIGGTTAQVLVQDDAAAIMVGDLDVAVVVGAEALATRRQAKRAGERLAWSHRSPSPAPMPFEAPFHPVEVAHGVFPAWLTFPVFDVARRAALGMAPDDYAAGIGRLLAPMSEVAAKNPYAWFQHPVTAEEIATPSPGNRMVGYPYTKQAVAIMDVDMAAAVVIASHARADELGVPADRRAYLHGWCGANDPVYLAEHPDLGRSPAMTAASAEALRVAGVGIDDVAHLDLYSCFASSVAFACDALGIDANDERGLTVTGGLPFCGGAGSTYLLHSIATMIDVLRRDPGTTGLVSGVGMHMTKHVFAVYGTDPPPTGRPALPDTARVQDAVDTEPPVEIVARHAGPATVASYTVAHDRSGVAEWGLVIADVPGGRTYGRVEDADLLASLEAEEWVGREVGVEDGPDGVNLVHAG